MLVEMFGEILCPQKQSDADGGYLSNISISKFNSETPELSRKKVCNKKSSLFLSEPTALRIFRLRPGSPDYVGSDLWSDRGREWCSRELSSGGAAEMSSLMVGRNSVEKPPGMVLKPCNGINDLFN